MVLLLTCVSLLCDVGSSPTYIKYVCSSTIRNYLFVAYSKQFLTVRVPLIAYMYCAWFVFANYADRRGRFLPSIWENFNVLVKPCAENHCRNWKKSIPSSINSFLELAFHCLCVLQSFMWLWFQNQFKSNFVAAEPDPNAPSPPPMPVEEEPKKKRKKRWDVWCFICLLQPSVYKDNFYSIHNIISKHSSACIYFWALYENIIPIHR